MENWKMRLYRKPFIMIEDSVYNHPNRQLLIERMSCVKVVQNQSQQSLMESMCQLRGGVIFISCETMLSGKQDR